MSHEPCLRAEQEAAQGRGDCLVAVGLQPVLNSRRRVPACCVDLVVSLPSDRLIRRQRDKHLHTYTFTTHTCVCVYLYIHTHTHIIIDIHRYSDRNRYTGSPPRAGRDGRRWAAAHQVEEVVTKEAGDVVKQPRQQLEGGVGGVWCVRRGLDGAERRGTVA